MTQEGRWATPEKPVPGSLAYQVAHGLAIAVEAFQDDEGHCVMCGHFFGSPSYPVHSVVMDTWKEDYESICITYCDECGTPGEPTICWQRAGLESQMGQGQEGQQDG